MPAQTTTPEPRTFQTQVEFLESPIGQESWTNLLLVLFPFAYCTIAVLARVKSLHACLHCMCPSKVFDTIVLSWLQSSKKGPKKSPKLRSGDYLNWRARIRHPFWILRCSTVGYDKYGWVRSCMVADVTQTSARGLSEVLITNLASGFVSTLQHYRLS